MWYRGSVHLEKRSGDRANGLIDDFASISSTEPEGDFDHSTLAEEGMNHLTRNSGESNLILGSSAASTGSLKVHDSEDQSISLNLQKNIALGACNPKRKKDSSLEEENSFRAWYKPSPFDLATRVGYRIVFWSTFPFFQAFWPVGFIAYLPDREDMKDLVALAFT
ncbi:hypothetical protein SDJN03_19563, partial [Cucurbita argyrosperma subsp. sororia]